MRKPFFYLVASISLFLTGCAARASPPPTFAGTYEGAAIGVTNPDGKSLVESLEITLKAGAYTLSGYMNDTNQEPGMDQPSNSRWQWNGVGAPAGAALVFTYSTPDGQHGKGVVSRNRHGLLLVLDGTRYQLHKSLP